MPGPLLTRQDIANGAISGQPRKFAKIGGKSRAARVFFYFPTADLSTAMPHALGRTPTGFRVVNISRDSVLGAPGTVYADGGSTATGKTGDSQAAFSRNFIVLKCTTANAWSEIELF